MSGFFAEGDLTPNLIEQARQRVTGYVDLTSSNPTEQGFLFPPEILAEASGDYWTSRRYKPEPFGWLPARQAITKYYTGRTPALPLDPGQIFIAASTSEAYSLLFALLTEPGDNILGPDVTYPLFEYLAAIHHVELRPYRLDESKGWQIDPASIAEQADERTRAVLLISPHNPTGMIVEERQAALLELGLPVICDEVFAEFTYKARTTPPFGALHPELPVFHLNGISKLFALPDLKLGWIAFSGPDTELKKYTGRLELLNDTFLSCSSLIQWMLPALFEKGWPFVEGMRQQVRQNLDLALEKLKDCPALEVAAPAGGYYLFPKVRQWQDEDALVLYLLEQGGVLVHPGYFYGYEGNGAHIMISCLTKPEKLAEGLDRLVKALA